MPVFNQKKEEKVKLQINNCDSSVEHSENHVVDILEGSNEYTFIHFLSPALVKTSSGLTEVEPGACVMYTPQNPQYYRGREIVGRMTI